MKVYSPPEALSWDRESQRPASGLLPAWIIGWLPPSAIFVLHLATGLYLRYMRGVSITADPLLNRWDAFWQTIPMHLLKEDLLSTLLHYHAQPPLLNVYGLVMRRLFGSAQLSATHNFQIILGAFMAAMVYSILRHLTARPRLSFVIAVLMAFNPALFLYEAFILYTLAAGFLVVLFVYMMVKFKETGRLRFLYGFILVLTMLILKRAPFHLALLIPFIGIGCILAGRQWRRFLVVALVMSIMPFAWYAKNCVMFGFFGTSSWLGSNLWRIATANYSMADLQEYHAQGVIEKAAVERKYFDRPSEFEAYGFDQKSPHPALSLDNYNNINMIAISKMHQRNAVALIAHDPAHYLWNVREAYSFFCKPTFFTRPLNTNARRLPSFIHDLSLLDGRRLTAYTNRHFSTSFSSLYEFLIPLLVFTFGVRLLWCCRLSPKKWLAFISEHPVMMVMVLLVAFITLISIFFEHGENCRFKFSIEALIICLGFGLTSRRFWTLPATAT